MLLQWCFLVETGIRSGEREYILRLADMARYHRKQ